MVKGGKDGKEEGGGTRECDAMDLDATWVRSHRFTILLSVSSFSFDGWLLGVLKARTIDALLER